MGRARSSSIFGDVHYVDSHFLSELMMFARKCDAMERPLVVFSPDPFGARTVGIAGVAKLPDYNVTFDAEKDLVMLWTRDGGKRLRRMIEEVRGRGISTLDGLPNEAEPT